jgi:ABC-type lipoprotein export system ATPase subunit
MSATTKNGQTFPTSPEAVAALAASAADVVKTYGRGATTVTALDHVSERGRKRLRRERLGFVFQAFNLPPTRP